MSIPLDFQLLNMCFVRIHNCIALSLLPVVLVILGLLLLSLLLWRRQLLIALNAF